MRSCFVVILSPHGKLGPNMREAHEPVLVQAFIMQAPIEALDVGVLRALAGLRQFQLNPITAGAGPLVQRVAGKFGPLVVRSDRSRVPRNRATCSSIRTT